MQAASRTPARCQSKPGHQEGQIPLRGQSGRGPQSFRRSLSYNRSHARVRVAANKACGGLHVCRVFVCVQFPPLQSAPLHNSNGQGPQRSYRTSVARNLVRVGFSTQVRDWGKFCRQHYPVHMEIRPYRKAQSQRSFCSCLHAL